MIAEHGVRRLLAAAQARAIDDVVVQQRRRVDELDDRGGGDVVLAAPGAAGARREQHGQRPQPLAAVVDDVVGDLIDQSDVAAQPAHDHPVDVGPILADERPKSIQRRHRRIRVCHDMREFCLIPTPIASEKRR